MTGGFPETGLTRAEQQALAHATVAIPGMGGVGGPLITLVRTGVERFHLAGLIPVSLPASIASMALECLTLAVPNSK
jgi:hypothetical protein